LSRSKHQTHQSVFGGKSKAEIDSMFAEGDADVDELLEKRRLKREARSNRAAK